MLTKAILDVYWHPLSRFPGPRLYAGSRLPYVFFALTGRLAVQHHKIYKKYGPIVRTAPNGLSFLKRLRGEQFMPSMLDAIQLSGRIMIPSTKHAIRSVTLFSSPMIMIIRE